MRADESWEVGVRVLTPKPMSAPRSSSSIGKQEASKSIAWTRADDSCCNQQNKSKFCHGASFCSAPDRVCKNKLHSYLMLLADCIAILGKVVEESAVIDDLIVCHRVPTPSVALVVSLC